MYSIVQSLGGVGLPTDYLALPGVVKFGFVASETQTMHLD